MKEQLRAGICVFALLTLLTGVAYPAIVTAIAQVVFHDQANGSVMEKDGKSVGSKLIGQSFESMSYFWGRPSATGPVSFNAAASTGSNLGPTNPAHLDAVRSRVERIRAAHPEQSGPVPVDLVTTSASGLDPHISPAAAAYQVGRVAKARRLRETEVLELVAQHTEERTLGVLGERRVHVLELNLALDKHSTIQP